MSGRAVVLIPRLPLHIVYERQYWTSDESNQSSQWGAVENSNVLSRSVSFSLTLDMLSSFRAEEGLEDDLAYSSTRLDRVPTALTKWLSVSSCAESEAPAQVYMTAREVDCSRRPGVFLKFVDDWAALSAQGHTSLPPTEATLAALEEMADQRSLSPGDGAAAAALEDMADHGIAYSHDKFAEPLLQEWTESLAQSAACRAAVPPLQATRAPRRGAIERVRRHLADKKLGSLRRKARSKRRNSKQRRAFEDRSMTSIPSVCDNLVSSLPRSEGSHEDDDDEENIFAAGSVQECVLPRSSASVDHEDPAVFTGGEQASPVPAATPPKQKKWRRFLTLCRRGLGCKSNDKSVRRSQSVGDD